MAGKTTLTIIKPTAVKKGYIGGILAKINEAGFRILALKYITLSVSQSKAFYKVHADRPFYNDLTQFMSSGPVVTAILEKDNAVASFRELIGATNPADSKEGTIRNLYGTSLQENAVHGSDSDENAVIEANFMFSQLERI